MVTPNTPRFALTLFEIDSDPKLKTAYAAYEMILESFQKTFKRQPVCELYVGFVWGSEKFRSTVTARWNDNDAGRKDAERVREISDSVLIKLTA